MIDSVDRWRTSLNSVPLVAMMENYYFRGQWLPFWKEIRITSTRSWTGHLSQNIVQCLKYFCSWLSGLLFDEFWKNPGTIGQRWQHREVDQISTLTEAFPKHLCFHKNDWEFWQNKNTNTKLKGSRHLWFYDAIYNKIICIYIKIKNIYWSDIKRRTLLKITIEFKFRLAPLHYSPLKNKCRESWWVGSQFQRDFQSKIKRLK